MTAVTDTRNSAEALPDAAAGFRDILVELPGSTAVFSGFQIAWVSTRERDRQLRWTELTLYWVRGVPRTRYALINAGQSAQYHLAGGPCNRGIPRTVASLADEEFQRYQPCPACRVADLDDLDDSAIISAETTRNGITTARTAESLILDLRRRNQKRAAPAHARPADAPAEPPAAPAEENPLSEPAYRLLTIASAVDPDIRAALIKPRPLRPSSHEDGEGDSATED